jgi:hypothetical protein
MMILVHNEGRPGATNHKVAGGTIWRSSLGTVESHLGCDGECDDLIGWGGISVTYKVQDYTVSPLSHYSKLCVEGHDAIP